MWRSIKGSQPVSPGRVAVHASPAIGGADFSLGSWWVLLLSLPDSDFVLNMKSFPSCRPRAFSLCFYHPVPSLPLPTPPHMVPAWLGPPPPPTTSHVFRTWLRPPHPSSSTGSSTYLQKPNLSSETEAFPRRLWALPAFSGGLG